MAIAALLVAGCGSDAGPLETPAETIGAGEGPSLEGSSVDNASGVRPPGATDSASPRPGSSQQTDSGQNPSARSSATSHAPGSTGDQGSSDGQGSSAAPVSSASTIPEPSTPTPSTPTPTYPDCPEACMDTCRALGHGDVVARGEGSAVSCVVRSGARCAFTRNTRDRLIFPPVRHPCADADALCTLTPEPRNDGTWDYRCAGGLSCPRNWACVGEGNDLLTSGCTDTFRLAIPCALSTLLPGDDASASTCNPTRGACESPEGAWCDGDAFLCERGLACDTSLVEDGPRRAGRCVDLSGPWEPCDAERGCTGDTVCFGILPEPGASCAFLCQTASDCPLPGGVDTLPVCVEAADLRLCRLPCASDEDCPTDSTCWNEGTGRFCL